ncbi:hypothetical protein P692DRAFT_20821658 [Suillus brevipes Sb2]|nr:hypothetical protein P692DRAFT_20821658 [Suillus brevipes Sb2]
MFGSAGTYWLSLNLQHSEFLSLQLQLSPITTSPLTTHSPQPSTLVSPSIQPAVAKTGWVEPFTPSGSPILQYPDDPKAQGGLDGEGGVHNSSLYEVMDPSSLQLPALGVVPLAPEVIVPDESMWIDAHRIIHVTTSFDESREPSVEHLCIVETPSSLPPELEPPPYIAIDNDSSRQMTTFLPVPDRHQHLLDYFATDLPGLSDKHPVLLNEIAEEYFEYWTGTQNSLPHDNSLTRSMSLFPLLDQVAKFHGEHRLAASIEAALLMPYPDLDIVHLLVEEHLLDQEDEFKILKFARARD